MKKTALCLLLTAALLLIALPGLCKTITIDARAFPVEEDGWYDTMEEVAVYLTAFDKLPGNYLTKREAQALGWVNREGNLWDVAPGCSIGGDRFGNYEGALPDEKGRKWTECDIGFEGRYRNGERIVFSSDGLIYYTGDHYATFDALEVVYNAAEDSGEAVDGSDLINTLLDLWLSL